MRIGLDMMGGDFAPAESCAGALSFLSSHEHVHLELIGDETAIHEKMNLADPSRYTIVHAPEIIGMHEHPTRAMKEKPASSLVVGFQRLAQGEIDAFISAGNTGVMLVGAAHIIKPIQGVLRPTIPTLVPTIDGGYSLMLDVGINADCKPENLNQFAVLGSLYARDVLGIDNPRVGLLNIGEEETKGNILAQATYPLLKSNASINFIGNIEGRDILANSCDVIVCDGFTGNILLKLAESLYDVVMLRRNIQDEFLAKFNHELYGGVPVLGVNKPVVVGHGISKAHSFHGMLDVAAKMIESNLLGHVESLM
ncbi:MAG: phosphate acyltransferase PlsX [Chitinophagaceae bacterium]|nr:phosphate acyltransferase PlsX [Chitinophagaceae bacterium]